MLVLAAEPFRNATLVPGQEQPQGSQSMRVQPPGLCKTQMAGAHGETFTFYLPFRKRHVFPCRNSV